MFNQFFICPLRKDRLLLGLSSRLRCHIWDDVSNRSISDDRLFTNFRELLRTKKNLFHVRFKALNMLRFIRYKLATQMLHGYRQNDNPVFLCLSILVDGGISNKMNTILKNTNNKIC